MGCPILHCLICSNNFNLCSTKSKQGLFGLRLGTSHILVNVHTFFLFTVIVTFINAWSVSLATKVQNFFTVMKLIAVAVVVVGGAYQLAIGNEFLHLFSYRDENRSLFNGAVEKYF